MRTLSHTQTRENFGSTLDAVVADQEEVVITRAGSVGEPNVGIGKPEALKHGFHGYWSRRITDEHRLIYKVTGDDIRIAACRYHYE